jgi:hypothetical protein
MLKQINKRVVVSLTLSITWVKFKNKTFLYLIRVCAFIYLLSYICIFPKMPYFVTNMLDLVKNRIEQERKRKH